MATYHEELVKAGVLTGCIGLQPSSKGWRVKHSGGRRTVIRRAVHRGKGAHRRLYDHPGEVEEEALEWTKRFPNPVSEGAEAEIEVRQLFELEDFGPSDAMNAFAI